MKKRYCVTYVGDDSRKHKEAVWASDHNEAIKKLKARGVDMVTGVRKVVNPFLVAGIVIVILTLFIIELAH